MNRLTKRYKSGIVTLDADAFMETQETVDREIQNFYPAKKAVERLAEYEDAEENGLMLHLPCKVGDTVYHIKNLYKGKKITSRVIEQLCIDSFVIGDNGKPQANACDNERNDWHYYDIVDFGRYVFLTREEAEQALKGDCNA